jgi:hypothetical protein
MEARTMSLSPASDERNFILRFTVTCRHGLLIGFIGYPPLRR